MLPEDLVMKAGADGGMADGCRERRLRCGGRLCPHRRAVCTYLRKDFPCLYTAENVVLESLWSTEELRLGSAHHNARIELEGNHIQCADEICKLEKSVSGWADSLCELYRACEMFAEDIGKYVGDGGLSAVIVDFNSVKSLKQGLVAFDETREFGLESFRKLGRACHVSFVGGDAFVLEVHFPCECHHAGKHALAQAAAKKLISLFAAYERSSVKDECFGVEPNFIYGAIHVGQLLANVDGLIVKHHSYDIETGVIVRIEETAGFVDEYTQFLLIAFHAPHKRKRRKSLPATSTGTFPRIQVVPVFQPSPTCMIANFLAWRKGVARERVRDDNCQRRKG